jgi:hypothetical protein
LPTLTLGFCHRVKKGKEKMKKKKMEQRRKREKLFIFLFKLMKNKQSLQNYRLVAQQTTYKAEQEPFSSRPPGCGVGPVSDKADIMSTRGSTTQ